MASSSNFTHYDPMGQCVWDYYNGKKDAEITVYSNLEKSYISGEYLFRNMKNMPVLEKLALKEAKGHILDVGACSGCHSVILQDTMNKQVTALDISEYAINTLKARNIKAIQADILSLESGQFDTILLLMNGLGLAGSPQKTIDYLKHLKSLLAPGGAIIGDSADIIEAFREDDGSVLLELTGQYYGQITFQLEYDGKKGESFDWLYLDFDLLSDCAKKAGLRCECLAEGETDNYLVKLYV